MFYIYTIMELRSLRYLINNMLKVVLLYYYQQNDLDMWLFFWFFLWFSIAEYNWSISLEFILLELTNFR